jgi:twinkle protein
MQAKFVSEQLAQRCEEIATMLYPAGKKVGTEYCVGNLLGHAGDSLKIHLTGSKAGIWCDFATGERGDLLDLWLKSKNITLMQALSEACDYLGISQPNFISSPKKQYNRPKTSIDALGGDKIPYLMGDRRITLKTLQSFKISLKGNEIVFPYIRDGEVIFLKYLVIDRNNGKKQIRAEANCEPCLFGWHMIPPDSRSITICEGEIDAMTLSQYGIPAVSVPFGAGTGKKQEWIENDYLRLSVYDEIYICMDNDPAGKIAAMDIIERLGNYRCKLVELPLKDANECLINNISAEDMQAFFAEAVSQDPKELKLSSHFFEKALQKLYPPSGVEAGYQPPWQKVKGKVLFRPRELTIWGGQNGHGKTQFLTYLCLHMLEQGAKVLIASLEIMPEELYSKMLQQAAGMALPSEEYCKAINKHINGLYIYDLVDTINYTKLLDVFLYAKQRYGVDVFVIDSLAMLTVAEDDYKGQKELIEKLCKFKNYNNCQVHLVVHPRKGLDANRIPTKIDYKGTGAISDLADSCFTVWRNKEKERLKEKYRDNYILNEKEQQELSKPDTLLICDKQRKGNWEGILGFWYDIGSHTYKDSEYEKTKGIVNYSCTENKS